ARSRRKSSALPRRPPCGFSQHHPPHVRKKTAEIRNEAGCLCAVDDAMIVRKRKRHDESRRETLAVPNRFGCALRHAQYRNFGRVDDGSEGRATDAPER